MISFNIIPSDIKDTSIHLKATYIDKGGNTHTCETHTPYGMSYNLITVSLSKLIIAVSGGRDYPYRENKFAKVLFKRYASYLNFIADSEIARRYPSVAPIIDKWRSLPRYLRKDDQRDKCTSTIIELALRHDKGEDITYFVKDMVLSNHHFFMGIHSVEYCGPDMRATIERYYPNATRKLRHFLLTNKSVLPQSRYGSAFHYTGERHLSYIGLYLDNNLNRTQLSFLYLLMTESARKLIHMIVSADARAWRRFTRLAHKFGMSTKTTSGKSTLIYYISDAMREGQEIMSYITPRTRIDNALIFAERWHREVQRITRERLVRDMQKQNNIQEDTPFPPSKFNPPPHFKRINTLRDLLHEGNEMEHCVASYVRHCIQDGYEIFSVNYSGERATVCIYPDGRVQQAQGPRNKPNKASRYAEVSWNEIYNKEIKDAKRDAVVPI